MKLTGLDATGVSDCTATIQKALTAGGIIQLPAGTFRISDELTVTKDNVQLVGAGMDATTLLLDDVAGTRAGALAFVKAPTASTTTIASNVAIGDFTITLLSTSGLSVGEMVHLYDANSYGPGGGSVYGGTWITRILSINADANQITLEEGSPIPLASGAGSGLETWPKGMLHGARVSDLTIRTSTYATNRSYGFLLHGCENALVERVRVRYIKNGQYYAYKCFAPVYDKCIAESAPVAYSSGGFIAQHVTSGRWVSCFARECVYGIVITASPRCAFDSPTVSGGGHGASSVGGRGLKMQMGSNFGTITSPRIDGHGETYGIRFPDSAYCTVTNANIQNVTGGNAGGISVNAGVFLADMQWPRMPFITSHHNKLVGGIISHTGVSVPGPAIAIWDAGTGSTSLQCSVIGVTCVGSIGGISIVGSDNTVMGCMFESYGAANGLDFSFANTGSASTRNHIVGNSFSNGGRGKAYDGSAGTANILFGNNFNSEDYTLQSNDVMACCVRNGVLVS